MYCMKQYKNHNKKLQAFIFGDDNKLELMKSLLDD